MGIMSFANWLCAAVYISQYAVLPGIGPAGAAGVAAADLSSLGAVFVSLEQALNHSNPHAAKPGKTNFLMVLTFLFR
jgi:hypothetical protein